MARFHDLLKEKGHLLADGAVGTNYMGMGLQPGEAPEAWNFEAPEKVKSLHQQFVDGGADIILTNTFGGNRHRLKLHDLQDKVHEVNKTAAKLAGDVAATAGRPVLIGGSVGPTGELFQPLGTMTHEDAVAAFKEQMEGLKDGGADIIWIETMSSPEEMRAAAEAASGFDMPFTITASFDTAGKTMMGLAPADLGALSDDLSPKPSAYGSNCGVGASDLLVAILAITEKYPEAVIIAKANCGIPQIQGADVVYTGTPELMADYAKLAMDAGARIIGGCCGTSPSHLAAMREAVNEHTPGTRPTPENIIERIGPLVSPPNEGADTDAGGAKRGRRGRRRG